MLVAMAVVQEGSDDHLEQGAGDKGGGNKWIHGKYSLETELTRLTVGFQLSPSSVDPGEGRAFRSPWGEG